MIVDELEEEEREHETQSEPENYSGGIDWIHQNNSFQINCGFST